MTWHVYILECGDGSLYTGITNDIERRIAQHRSGKGAKYTRTRGVKKLLYTVALVSRSEALKREHEIKRLTRKEKLRIIKGS